MINVEVEDRLTPLLKALAAAAEGEDRIRLSEAMEIEVRQLIVFHFTTLAETRHATADRLGGTQTGYIADLAQNFDQVGTITVDDSGLEIAMRHPVISRAFHDVTIRPVAAKALTIPVNGLAYGRSPREFAGQLFIYVNKTTHDAFLALRTQNKGERPTLMYLLAREVTQKQDRTLFPSESNLATAGAIGIRKELKAIRQEAHSAT